MAFIDQILLTPAQIAFVIVLGIFIVWTGRPEWALGIYMSLSLWTRTAMVGPVAGTWVLLGVIVAATLVYMLRTKGMTLMPNILRPQGEPILPPRDRWIVTWMILWWVWIVMLVMLFEPWNGRGSVLRSLVLYTILPLPVFLLFAGDIRRIRGFATAYVATTLFGGWEALSVLGLTLDYLIRDPALKESSILRLNLVNYHWFAYNFAITLVLSIALFLESRRLYRSVLLLTSAAICAYFLLLAGSRQSVNGAVIVLLVFVFWAVRRSGWINVRALLFAGVALFVGVSLYLTAPELIVRTSQNETTVTDTVDVLDDRSFIWEQGWQVFLTSPIWGRGFEFNSHNIFVNVLSDQGVVGMVFFAGVLIFIIRQCRGIWSVRVPDKLAIWRMAFFCVIVFTLVHGQASGNVVSAWYFFWAVAMLWWLRTLVKDEYLVPVERFASVTPEPNAPARAAATISINQGGVEPR